METLTAPPMTVGDFAGVDMARGDVTIAERDDVTVDELERLSLPYPAELYNGKVVYKMANLVHAAIQANIAKKIGVYLDDSPIGIVGTEASFRLWSDRSKESRVPDVCFISNERLPEDWEHFPVMAPDLAVEIVSPEDNFMSVMEKVDAYLQQGAKIVWLVFSSTREVLVCTAEEKRSVRGTLTVHGVLPGFELPVQEIFKNVKVKNKAASN
jgi:Uma2 family endonuclease